MRYGVNLSVNFSRVLRHAALAVAIASYLPTHLAAAKASFSEEAVSYSIPEGDLVAALDLFSKQSGIQLLYQLDLVAGKKSQAVNGALQPSAALARLLEGTGIVSERANESTFVLKRSVSKSAPLPEKSARSSARSPEGGENIVGMPAIMVQGSRTLNTDITRTRDDPQPYVVFDRDLIERSGATSLEQLLQQRLPMNTSVSSVGSGMAGQDYPSTSSINLRGLGQAQTLILLDGHRMSSPSIHGAHTQGEISGIPLAAIERIEVLPSTASGIYGGSATGGVINIITRKDYSGGEARVTYDNTFSTDSAVRKLDFVFGQNFNAGRTNFLLSASYSDANELTQGDRASLLHRGQGAILENSPTSFFAPGSMPLGGTPNIASSDGSNLVLKSGASLGSAFTHVPYGYSGIAEDAGAALVANAGKLNWGMAPGVLGSRRSLYTEPKVKSGNVVLRHRFGDRLQAFVDLATSDAERRYLAGGYGPSPTFQLSADSIYNPFVQDIHVRAPISGSERSQVSVIEHDRAVVGLIAQLTDGWQASLDYTWDRTTGNYSGGGDAAGFLGLVNGGNVDILRDLGRFPVDVSDYDSALYEASNHSTLKDINLRVSGALGDLPGGRPILSAAISHRTELISDLLASVTPTFHQFFPARSTSVASAYVEYRMPLFSKENSRSGLKELELQVAARHEKYVSKSGEILILFGELPPLLPTPAYARNEISSTDPTIGLRWKPVDDLALRVSYGTGFLPPSLGQLVPINNGELYEVASDPRRGNTASGLFTATFQGNPELTPEKSKSWSSGLIYTPDKLPGLRLSVDYTRIDKTNNIGYLGYSFQEVLDNENLLPELVVRGPNLPDDPGDWAGPITHINLIPMNLASLRLEAWDVQLDYRWDTEQHGSFDLFLVGTWQQTYDIQAVTGLPKIDYVGDGTWNPLRFKSNAGATWNQNAWRLGWNISHFDSYQAGSWSQAILEQGNDGKVASQTYHDAFANYDFGLSDRDVPTWLSRTQLQLGVRNIFNKRPPFDAGGGPPYYSAFGSPRLASYYLTVTTRF